MELIVAFVASCVVAYEEAVKHCYCPFPKCWATFLKRYNLVISWLPLKQQWIVSGRALHAALDSAKLESHQTLT